jgi:hypothetical protein
VRSAHLRFFNDFAFGGCCTILAVGSIAAHKFDLDPSICGRKISALQQLDATNRRAINGRVAKKTHAPVI